MWMKSAFTSVFLYFVRIFWDLKWTPKLIAPEQALLRTGSTSQHRFSTLQSSEKGQNDSLYLELDDTADDTDNLNCLVISPNFNHWWLRHKHTHTDYDSGSDRCVWGGSRGLRSSVLHTTVTKIVWGGSPPAGQRALWRNEKSSKLGALQLVWLECAHTGRVIQHLKQERD